MALAARTPANPVEEDLSHALAALSTACDCVGPEVAMLMSDAAIAKAYLAHGWSVGGSIPS
jgi:hypothetical protein